MTETDSILLEHLRAIRAKLDQHSEEFRDVKARLLSLEKPMALIQSDMVDVRHVLDGHGIRLGRIEQRLELSDAPAE